MKRIIFFILCIAQTLTTLMATTMLRIDQSDHAKQLEDSLLDELPYTDTLIKRIGIKGLIEQAIKTIELLKGDQVHFEETLHGIQQELHRIKNNMHTMVIPNNECIKVLQSEVHMLKWALAINFGAIVACQAYFYYDQF